MSGLEFWLFSVSMCGVFLSMILFVLFGQITVRKLKKNPKTKDELGVEFASGWNILNVAGALSRPKWLNEKFSQSALSSLAANSEVLYKNTNIFDRILARVFWYSYVVFGTLIIILMILNLFDVFE